MARECNVSRRTIYRDLSSLATMNINISYNGKYKLANDIAMPTLSFTRDEQEIIGYCLENTELVKSPKMHAQIRNIELKILSMLKGRANSDLNTHLQSNARRVERFNKKEDDIIGQFMSATFNNQTVDVTINSGIGLLRNMMPKTLEVKGKIWWLIFQNQETGKPRKVRLENIKEINPRASQ
jgi:predicted DNA-binding transcriptional regulator YafY